MIIIAGYELVNAKDRDGYVAAFRGLVSRAREFDGCIHVAITADSVDPERVDSVEVWRDAKSAERVAKASQGSAHEETQALGSATVRRHRWRPPLLKVSGLSCRGTVIRLAPSTRVVPLRHQALCATCGDTTRDLDGALIAAIECGGMRDFLPVFMDDVKRARLPS